MKPDKTSTSADFERARVKHIPDENEPEDMPSEIEREDIDIEGRKPDLGETEEDSSSQ